MNPEPTCVRIEQLGKSFQAGRTTTQALDGITLEISRGSFVCVVGASGCGKSTLLNLIAGLERPSAGALLTSGRTALMFQDAALFPWLTVVANVELPMRLAGIRRAERRRRSAELLDLVQLGDAAGKRPHELSGGMRQRVALARAFAQDADILLMDEPFGALDAMTRDVMHDELEAIWTRSAKTVVFVTHNVREAVRLGDEVVLFTSRPGTIAAKFDVALSRPRRIEDADVAELAAAITRRLREEVAGHARR